MIGQDEWRSALAALAGGRGDPALRHRAAVDLAARMVAMAADGEGESLGFLLRPDPKLRATTWRVRQFRLGDIAPTSITDHSDAGQAVLSLARPERDALVAGELLAVARDGSAWVALSRNESEVVVQAPAPDTLLGPGARADGYGPLLGRWRTALDLAPLSEHDAGKGASAVAADVAEAPPESNGAPPAEAVMDATSVDRLAAALSSLEGVVGRLAGEPAAAPSDGRSGADAPSDGDDGDAPEVPATVPAATTDAEVPGGDVGSRLDELQLQAVDARVALAAADERLAALLHEQTAEIRLQTEQSTSGLAAVGDRVDTVAASISGLATAAAVAEVTTLATRTATSLDGVREASAEQVQQLLGRLLATATTEQLEALADRLAEHLDAVKDQAASAEDLAALREHVATKDQMETLAARTTAVHDAVSSRFATLHHSLQDRPLATAAAVEEVVERIESVRALAASAEQLASVHDSVERHARAAAGQLDELHGIVHTALTEQLTALHDLVEVTASSSQAGARVTPESADAQPDLGAELAALQAAVLEPVEDLRASVPRQLDAVMDGLVRLAGRSSTSSQLDSLQDAVAALAAVAAKGVTAADLGPLASARAVAAIGQRLEALEAKLQVATVEPAAAPRGASNDDLVAGVLDAIASIDDRIAALERDLSVLVKRLVTTERLATATDGLRSTFTTFVATQLAELRNVLPSRADHDQLAADVRALTDKLASRGRGEAGATRASR